MSWLYHHATLQGKASLPQDQNCHGISPNAFHIQISPPIMAEYGWLTSPYECLVVINITVLLAGHGRIWHGHRAVDKGHW